ncbi:MAG: SET domain-containing protein-lysine N-methyltransferase [Bacteroidetes bacterium]|nr:SET domain-containing protein-lysine N-methyltransferase [Bacteroidota bacterium]
MIASFVFIDDTENKGRGVFTSQDIQKNSVIEISPVIVMNSKDRKLLDQTLLHDYIFEWGYNQDQCCMALGYVAVYNHSYESNCEYEMNYDEDVITVKAIRFIKSGEELSINYNGDWNNKKKVWFDVSID